MNRKQRDSNRRSAERLAHAAHLHALSKHTCDNCGEKGGHWVSTRGLSVAALVTGQDDSEGFWTCSKYYGPDGRRINHEPTALGHELSGMLVAVLTGNGIKGFS